MKLGDCEYVEGVLYDPDAATWGSKEEDLWRVGVTPLLPWISGPFTSVTVKPKGATVPLGKVLGSVEGPRHFEVVRAPFDCVVMEANPQVLADPVLVNRDPFGRGWIALLGKEGTRTTLVSLEEASGAIQEKLRSLRVHCFAEFPDVEMYEIGVECSAVLVRLDEVLGSSPSGTVVHLVSDDPTADIEMARWESQTGNSLVEARTDRALHHFIVRKR
jgi:glycine cleavage system H protein